MATYAETRPAPTLVETVPAADPAPLGLAAFALTTFDRTAVSGSPVSTWLSVCPPAIRSSSRGNRSSPETTATRRSSTA